MKKAVERAVRWIGELSTWRRYPLMLMLGLCFLPLMAMLFAGLLCWLILVAVSAIATAPALVAYLILPEWMHPLVHRVNPFYIITGQKQAKKAI